MIGYITHNVGIGESKTLFTLPGLVGSLKAKINSIDIANSYFVATSLGLDPVLLRLALITNDDSLDERAESNIANCQINGAKESWQVGAITKSNLQITDFFAKSVLYLGRDSSCATFGFGFQPFQIVLRIGYELVQEDELAFTQANL